MSRKILKTIGITAEQDQQLRDLAERTRVPVSEHVRQALDAWLARRAETDARLRGAQ